MVTYMSPLLQCMHMPGVANTCLCKRPRFTPCRMELPILPLLQLHQAEPLSGDASAAEEQGLSPKEQRRGIERQLQQLRSAIDAVLDSRAGGAGGASGSGSAGGGTAADLADAPDEFLDPILMTLMQVGSS